MCAYRQHIREAYGQLNRLAMKRQGKGHVVRMGIDSFMVSSVKEAYLILIDTALLV